MLLGRLLGVLLLATVLLAGCTDDAPDGNPSPSPPPSDPASSPTASPSAEPESAEDFIERWVQLQNDMEATGETEAFLDASTVNCAGCRALARTLSSTYEAGGYVRSDGWSVAGETRTLRSNDQLAVLRFSILIPPSTWKTSSEADEESSQGGKVGAQARVVKRDGEWLMARFVRLAS